MNGSIHPEGRRNQNSMGTNGNGTKPFCVMVFLRMPHLG